MSTTQQPEALRLAVSSSAMADEGEMIHLLSWHEIRNLLRADATELRRLHAECETLRTGYAAARLEIESLRARSLPEIKDMHNGPQQLNLSDRAMWVLGWNECRDAARDADRAMRAAQPAGVQQPGTAYAALPDEALLCAVADFLRSYKAKYANTGKAGLRSNAPWLAEVTALNAVYVAARASHGQAPAQAASQDFARTHHRLMGDAMKSRLENGSHEAMMDSYAQAAPAAVAGPSDASLLALVRTFLVREDECRERENDEEDCFTDLERTQYRILRASAVQALRDALAAAPTTQPAPANATAPSYDTLQLYKDLQDLWAEANAVDTVIGRPEVLMAKITKMRDAVGQMTATYLPAPQQEASPTAGMTIAQRILHVGGRNNAAGYVEFGSIQAVEALVRQVLRDLKPSPASQGDALDAARYRYLRDVPMELWPAELLSAIRLQQNAKWDAAIDAARAAHKEGERRWLILPTAQ